MSISFSGLASGLNTSEWVTELVKVKQQKVTSLQNELKTLQNKKGTLNDTRSIFNSFRTSIEKFTDTKFGGSFDLFGQKTATSSDDSIFTATATSSAAAMNYDIRVKQLASKTKASGDSVGKLADDNTKLASIGVTKGDLTVYTNGYKNTVTIDEETTFGGFKEKLEEMGITANIADGKLTISYAGNEYGNELAFGSTTDTTNVISRFGLTKAEDGTFSSSALSCTVNASSKLTDANAGFNQAITAGTFKIGNAEFTIDENMTIATLIAEINNSEDAQVHASWDSSAGKITLTSKTEGAAYINIEKGTSNFTDVMGLTASQGDSSHMITNKQELGKNALLTINGTEITSASNTISSDISRIEGVTLSLKKVSKEEDGDTTLKIEQNSEEILEAAKSFVSAYNNVIDKIAEVTGTNGNLKGESSLTSFKNTIRRYATGQNGYNGGKYSSLAQIGISTGKAQQGNVSTDGIDRLVIDEKEFLKALEENPDSVKSLLAGETGVLQQMENTVEMSLKSVTGFFDVKQSSLDSDISRMEKKVKTQQTKVSDYKSQLEKKFSDMELMISKMQQNYNSFLQ